MIGYKTRKIFPVMVSEKEGVCPHPHTNGRISSSLWPHPPDEQIYQLVARIACEGYGAFRLSLRAHVPGRKDCPDCSPEEMRQYTVTRHACLRSQAGSLHGQEAGSAR